MFDALWEKLDPGFIDPIWLLVGLFAVIAVVLLEVGGYRRRRQAIQYFAASHLAATLTASLSTPKRLLKSVLLTSAVGLLFIALARPHLFNDWTEESRTGLDVLLAVDCSKSMLSPDVKPNRLERAKLAISDFADQLPSNRLGLIAFAGDAFLECPLTIDHAAFQEGVRSLDTDTIPRPGTDIAAAIDLAAESLRSQPNNMKFLILVTDGEDLEGRALRAAKNAAQNGLKIFTVGVGTPEGERIPELDDSGIRSIHRDPTTGQDVVSRLDENMLRQIADATGGAYVPLGQRGEGLSEIYQRYIASLPKQNLEERREKLPIERFEWPLALAILFLMWEFMTSERVTSTTPDPAPSASATRPARRKKATVALVPLLIFGTISGPLAKASESDTAERAYKTGKYEDALRHYQKAVQGQPERNDLAYNAGDAAYKAGNFTEAENAYREALETSDLPLQEQAYYNLGNAQYQHGNTMLKVDPKKTIKLWTQALHSYDSAMKLQMSGDAKHNYDVVKAKLEELKKLQKAKGPKSGSPGSGDPNGDSDGDGDGQQSGQGNQGNDENYEGHGGNQDEKPNGANGEKPSDADKGRNVRTYSGQRAKDLQDPQIRSQQDAENLLDSLKDDQKRVSARSLAGNNQPPPPASGKDW